MGKTRNILTIVSALTLLLLCSCSVSKKTATTIPAPADDNISFINGIAIHRDGKATRHHLSPVRSENAAEPAEPPVSAGAPDMFSKYARLLGVSLQAIYDTSLYDFIERWWGTPYRYGGDSHNGIDCSAFVQALYAAVFHVTDLPRTAIEQYDSVKKIKHKDRLQEGDLVFFHVHTRRISHVGIYLQNNKFVHASLTQGITISDLTDPYWHRYYVCGGEVRNDGQLN